MDVCVCVRARAAGKSVSYLIRPTADAVRQCVKDLKGKELAFSTACLGQIIILCTSEWRTTSER